MGREGTRASIETGGDCLALTHSGSQASYYRHGYMCIFSGVQSARVFRFLTMVQDLQPLLRYN